MPQPYLFFGFLVFIVFPLYVTYRLYRKGYPGLALLTFLSMFVGVGPLVSGLMLWRTAGAPVKGKPSGGE